jgi:uncharacterized protein (TIGR02452 family)
MLEAIAVSIYRYGETTSLRIMSNVASLAKRVWSVVAHSLQFIAHLFSPATPIPTPINSDRVQSSRQTTTKPTQSWTNEKRAAISRQTIRAIEAGGYQTTQGTFISLESRDVLSKKSELIAPSTPSMTKRLHTPQLKVSSQDCLELAQEYVQNGHKTAVLIFASPIEPGGGFADGTNGQEEHICYRSEMIAFFQYQMSPDTIDQETSFYRSPLFCDPNSLLHRGIRENIFHPGGLIHTPDVLVFRASQAQEFAFLDIPFRVGMLTSPAPVNPVLVSLNNGKIGYRSKEAYEKVKITLRTHLQAACDAKYDAIVLGAFGCGAFSNPPDAIAQIYKEIIDDDFSAVPPHIAFAILNDPFQGNHNPRGNLKPFEELFALTEIDTETYKGHTGESIILDTKS